MLAYTAMRLLLFVGALGLLYLAGARGLLLVALAVLVSGLLSFWLLTGQRDEMSAALVARTSRLRSRLDAGARSEDADHVDRQAE